ncbi:MAG TPA: ABC transporter permease subunit [Thermoproteota archaeon]|nr:ABC transporter permease subunit [Thermoproteota archaeon]
MNKSLAMARREFTDAITSKRFWLIGGLFLLLYVANVYGVSFGFRMGEAFGSNRLTLQIGSNVATTLGYMAPLLGIALAFDAISGERERGTLRILLSRPLYREDVINGKMISAAAVIGLTIVASTLLSVSASILLQGITVTADDIVRLGFFVVISILFAFAYYAISLFISTFSSKSGHSLTISMGVWIFFAFILPILASFVASAIIGAPPALFNRTSPVQGQEPGQMFTAASNYTRRVAAITSTIEMISVNSHYSLVADSLFGLRSGAFGQQEVTQLNLAGVLSARWLDLLILVAFPVIFLVASYVVFTRRQET